MSAERPTDPNSPPAPDDDEFERPLGAGIDWSDPNSRLAPFYFAASGLLITALLAAVYLFYSFVPLNHTDVWVHLKYGERIVQIGHLPDAEPFSPFTDKSQKLVNTQWLTQVIYQLAFRAGEQASNAPPADRWFGGAEALRTLHSLLATAFVGLMALAVHRAGGSAPLAVVAAVVLAVAMLGTVGIHRPQTFGLVLFAAVIAAVSRSELPRRVVWLLPVLMTVWANLHGSFAVGFVFLGVTLVGRAIDAARAAGWQVREAGRDPSVRRLAWGGVVLAVVAAAVCNPYGPKLYYAVLTFGQNPNLKTLIEWSPLQWTEPNPGLVVYGLLVVANLIAFAVGYRTLTATRVLPLLAFALPPLLQQRMMTWWVPVGVWVLAAQVGAIIHRRGWTVPGVTPSFKITVVAALLAIPPLLLSPFARWLTQGELNGPRVVHPGTPYELARVLADPSADPGDRMKPLAAYLRANYAGRPVGPVFGSEGVGEFLVWSDPPGCPPFFFTHAHLFAPDHWRDSQLVLNGEPGWEAVLDRAGVNLIAVEPSIRRRLAAQVIRDPNWQVVLNEFESPVRKDPRSQLFIAVRKQPK